MKKSVKLLMSLAAISLLGGAVTGCGGSSNCPECPECPDTPVTPDDEKSGAILNIRCWNNEFQSRFRSYYPDYVKTEGDYDILRDGTKVKWIIVANDGGAYQTALDEALKNQDSVKDDEKVDIFLSEADYITKYKDSEYTLDVIIDVGLSTSDINDQYAYTQEVATSSSGSLKGVTWQAAPGLFAYRRDLAKKVFGTDDPTKVQEQLSSWDKFNAAAAKAKEKGVYMLSGYDDSYRTYSNNMGQKWVSDDGVLSIAPKMKQWVDDTKNFVDKGYCGTSTLWSGQWAADQGPNGNPVLGFFYSTWGINFTLLGNSLADSSAPQQVGNGLFGQYAVCEGPESYYWGGTWIHAAKGTDNIKQIKDIMLNLTCSRTVMSSITKIEQDYTNTVSGMDTIANDKSFGSAFLGGQNHIALFAKSAAKIDCSNMSGYDQACNEGFQNAMHDYFAGTVSYEKALANFKSTISEKHPEVTFNF